jgi:hypothetical protein
VPFPFAATVIHLHAHLLISKSACSNAHTAMRFALESPPGRPPPLVHQRRKTCMPQCAHYVPLDPGNGAALVYIYHTNAKGHFAIYVKTFQQWPLYRTFRQSLVASSSTIAIIFALNAILFFFQNVFTKVHWTLVQCFTNVFVIYCAFIPPRNVGRLLKINLFGLCLLCYSLEFTQRELPCTFM